jgi:hypothetical protein
LPYGPVSSTIFFDLHERGEIVVATNSSEQAVRRAKRKTYEKPTLVKGPLLTKITAVPPVAVSGNPVPCWVARAAFGESDFRWMIFRAWLVEDAPVWFRSLYLRHGEFVGAWLAGKQRSRTVVRAMMMPAVRRKLGV